MLKEKTGVQEAPKYWTHSDSRKSDSHKDLATEQPLPHITRITWQLQA